jgi:hypothetical protein
MKRLAALHTTMYRVRAAARFNRCRRILKIVFKIAQRCHSSLAPYNKKARFGPGFSVTNKKDLG